MKKANIIYLNEKVLKDCLLKTGKCKDENENGLTCNYDIEDMKVLQKACNECLKDTIYKDYKLNFYYSDTLFQGLMTVFVE
jgi:hypothetical protein